MFKILIAEDENNLRKVLSSTLSKEGYEVIGAENGQIAFDKFCKEKIRSCYNRCDDAGYGRKQTDRKNPFRYAQYSNSDAYSSWNIRW